MWEIQGDLEVVSHSAASRKLLKQIKLLFVDLVKSAEILEMGKKTV